MSKSQALCINVDQGKWMTTLKVFNCYSGGRLHGGQLCSISLRQPAVEGLPCCPAPLPNISTNCSLGAAAILWTMTSRTVRALFRYGERKGTYYSNTVSMCQVQHAAKLHTSDLNVRQGHQRLHAGPVKQPGSFISRFTHIHGRSAHALQEEQRPIND